MTLPLSACVNKTLVCSDKKARVFDSIVSNTLSIGDVVIGEEMMPLRIGMEWLVIAILFSIGMRYTPVSTLLMQSKIILRLSLSGRAKFSPSWRKHCMSVGMDTEDRLRNHPFRTVVRDEDLCEVKELECIDIKVLGDNVREGLLTFNDVFFEFVRKETLMSFLLNRLNFSVWRGMNGSPKRAQTGSRNL